MIYICAVLIGIVAGLRALLAPTIVSWGAALGALNLAGTWLAFLGWRWTPWLFSVAAIGELVNDKRATTPSRKIPPQFGVRIVAGALSGSAITAAGGNPIIGAGLGIVGAVIGTLGGASARGALARALGSDLPAALFEDTIAIIGGFVVVFMLAGA